MDKWTPHIVESGVKPGRTTRSLRDYSEQSSVTVRIGRAWSRHYPSFTTCFFGFKLDQYAALPDDEIATRVYPWFTQRRAASMTLRRDLLMMARACRILRDWSKTRGSAERFFLDLLAASGQDPKKAALQLGANGSKFKLPGLGIPLASETLRNMGFDLCKPDRHLCRAVGSFELVTFRKWPDRSKTKAPQADPNELSQTMTVLETFAHNVGERVIYVDNAIWLLCARSGASLRNVDLKNLCAGRSPGHPVT